MARSRLQQIASIENFAILRLRAIISMVEGTFSKSISLTAFPNPHIDKYLKVIKAEALLAIAEIKHQQKRRKDEASSCND